MVATGGASGRLGPTDSSRCIASFSTHKKTRLSAGSVYRPGRVLDKQRRGRPISACLYSKPCTLPYIDQAHQSRLGSLRLGFLPEGERVSLEHRLHGVAGFKITLQNRLGKRVLNPLLDRPL